MTSQVRWSQDIVLQSSLLLSKAVILKDGFSQMDGQHQQKIVLEVLRLNIWYLSLRQAQRYSLDDDTGSMSPYKVVTAFYSYALCEARSSPWRVSYTGLGNVATKTTTSRHAFICIIGLWYSVQGVNSIYSRWSDASNVFSLDFLIGGTYANFHGLPGGPRS